MTLWRSEAALRMLPAVTSWASQAQDRSPERAAETAHDYADALARESCRRYGHHMVGYAGEHCGRCGFVSRSRLEPGLTRCGDIFEGSTCALPEKHLGVHESGGSNGRSWSR